MFINLAWQAGYVSSQVVRSAEGSQNCWIQTLIETPTGL